MLFRINLVNPTRLTASISVVALAASLAACGGQQAQDNTTGGSSPAASNNAGSDKLALKQDVQLVGAGASFPAPLYQRWFQDFNGKQPKVQINYQSVGSGAGVEQFTKGTVDFGASDTAMKDDEIQKVGDKGVMLLPMTAGSIVLAYNLPEVTGELKLPRQVYTDILLGKITKWNDPKIAAANPGVTLPDQAITVVHRSDGSGTTGVFTTASQCHQPRVEK
jgi:phosphate transport system substrate-binding protein